MRTVNQNIETLGQGHLWCSASHNSPTPPKSGAAGLILTLLLGVFSRTVAAQELQHPARVQDMETESRESVRHTLEDSPPGLSVRLVEPPITWNCSQTSRANFGGDSGRQLVGELVYKISETSRRCLQAVSLTRNAMSFALTTAPEDLLFDVRALGKSLRLGTFKGGREFQLIVYDRQTDRARIFDGPQGIFVTTDERPFPSAANALPKLIQAGTGGGREFQQGFHDELPVGEWGGYILIPQDADGDSVLITANAVSEDVDVDVTADPAIFGATMAVFRAAQPGVYTIEIVAFDGKETAIWVGTITWRWSLLFLPFTAEHLGDDGSDGL
jgi:hypothetical protein